MNSIQFHTCLSILPWYVYVVSYEYVTNIVFGLHPLLAPKKIHLRTRVRSTRLDYALSPERLQQHHFLEDIAPEHHTYT